MEENEISQSLLDLAIRVHRVLGPGLFESVYEAVLVYELEKAGLHVARQVPLVVEYEGLKFNEAYRLDLLVEGKVIVELKSIEKLGPIHRKQLLTYVKLRGVRLGVLLNFGAETMREGFVRVVNGLS